MASIPQGKKGRKAQDLGSGRTVSELEYTLQQCSGFVKIVCGVANNAALPIMMDCLDKIADKRSNESYGERPCRPHPGYRHAAKAAFINVLNEKRNYRCTLLYPPAGHVRFFHVDDMTDQSKQRYTKQMTDREFFEFWEGTGTLAYQKSQPLLGSLWNKFRLSMIQHGVEHEELIAWGLVADAVLEIAVTIYNGVIDSVSEACGGKISHTRMNSIYGSFSLKRVSDAWKHALGLLEPRIRDYVVDEDKERNVLLGIEQLRELWMSADMPFDATIAAVEDFGDEIFSTRGHARKSILELTEMRNDAVKEMGK